MRPRTDVDALLSESDPWFSLAHKPTQAQKNDRRKQIVNTKHKAASMLVNGVGETVATAAFTGHLSTYPFLRGQQPDLYRSFMEKTWSSASPTGVVSLIHPESHFTEKKAAPLRREAYLRLRRHWQFINELVLFDVHHLVQYGVHVYSHPYLTPHFTMAASLYHPQTVSGSLVHDGSGPLPGLKDDEGQWDRRPHRDRIQWVEESVLKTWKSILENDDTPWLDTRMVYTVNTEAAAVLEKLAAAPRMKDLDLQFSSGWHESADKKKGYFDVGWGHPDSWNDVILQGPHLGISTPLIKQPNSTMKNNQDWTEIDLEALPADFIPATAYQPNYEMAYNEDYAKWMDLNGDWISARKFYRVAWRQMAATTGFRTMYPALIPPGTTHVNGVITAGMASSLQDQTSMLAAGAFLSSLLSDFVIRSAGTHLWPSLIEKIPVIMDSRLTRIATISYLRLNCLTSAYAPLWKAITNEDWTSNTPIRNAKKRFHAQNEIDAAVALSLNISVDELCTIYRTQFPVMRRYDTENHYDANGRKVSKEILKFHQKVRENEILTATERTWKHAQSGVTYTFEYPFSPLDREADLRRAYADLTYL